MVAATLEEIRRRLRWFADKETATASPLYSHLAGHAAADDEVAGLLAATDDGSAYPTLLFAAVHRVLATEPFHELINYYPSLGGSYGPDAALWPIWRRFVVERAARVRDLVATRITQTNEVGRAASLYPAVALAARQARAPVGLLEVGASAGLLLGLDTYGYRYQTEQAGQLVAGPTRATVGLHCALALAPGATLPKIPKKIPVAAKVGLDRYPVDLADEEEYAWLEACIWADQPERQRTFSAAAAAQRKAPPDLVAGDAVADLAAAAARIPAEVPLVVLSSHMLYLLGADGRAAFHAELAAIAAARPLWWVSKEDYHVGIEPLLPGRADLRPTDDEPAFSVLALIRWADGVPATTVLARTAAHGQRMEWLA